MNRGFNLLEIKRIWNKTLWGTLQIKNSITHNKKSLTGFTLVELLIVVAVVALLAAIAIYNMSGGITRSKVSRALGELSRFPSIIATRGKVPESDPWGSPYSYHDDGAKQYYYSWGPDKEDDGGNILYDPSNGTSSKGDVYILP